MARLGVDLSFLDKPDTAFQTSAVNVDDLLSSVPTLSAHGDRFEVPSGVHGVQFMQAQKDKADEKAAAENSLSLMALAGGPTTGAMPYGPSNYTHNANANIRMNHGTTTMAFLFNAGVLVAVDSRASMGSYIGSATVKKVIPISRFLLGTMAGGAADCSFWERNLAYQCRVHELREGRRITVAAASKLLANTVYQYRGRGLSMGTMVAGWDEVGGPALYYVDNDGTRLKGDKFSVGSGATYAYGVLDNEYRRDLTIEEAVDLGKRAIWHATHRDAYSGGTINVFVITQDGWKQHFAGDMNDLYYDHLKPIYDAPASAADDAEQKMEG